MALAGIATIVASASPLVSGSCKVWKTRSRPRAGAPIGRDMFDAEMVERPAHLRQTRPIELSASNGCAKIMAAPIRIQAQRQAMLAKHLLQSPER